MAEESELMKNVADAAEGVVKATTAAPIPRNLDFLLDVNLQVSVEVGRTRMTIQDLLQLGQGSVIELTKLAGEALALQRSRNLRACVFALLDFAKPVVAAVNGVASGGGGAPSRFSRIHLPRFTGLVRSGAEVAVNTAPSRSRPPRWCAASDPRGWMKKEKTTAGNPGDGRRL